MMITIEELKRALAYDPEMGLFTWLTGKGGVQAGATAGTPMLNDYIAIGVRKKKYLAHRLAWFYHYGKWPEGMIDHMNGNKADNRIFNLRPCDKSKNACNAKLQSNNKSGVKGVCWHKAMKKWHVQLRFNGSQHNLGFFDSLEKAERIVRRAREQYHGEFARHA